MDLQTCYELELTKEQEKDDILFYTEDNRLIKIKDQKRSKE